MLPLIVAILSFLASMVTHHQALQSLQFGIVSCMPAEFHNSASTVLAIHTLSTSAGRAIQQSPQNSAV